MKTTAIVLSDLHIGASASRLTYGEDKKAIYPSYEKFINKLLLTPIRKFLSNQTKIDYLILIGDVLDFSLFPYNVVFEEAKLFFSEIAKSRLFREVIYIQGNHDHYIWDMFQHERQLIRRIRNGKLPKPYTHIQTGILKMGANPELFLLGVRAHKANKRARFGKYGDTFLHGLLPEKSPNLPINVVYPNLYITGQGDKPLLAMLTHGHFFCLPWILLTTIFKQSLGLYDKDGSIDENRLNLASLEEVNASLTEFTSTSLGQAGILTEAAQIIYNELKDGEKAHLKAALNELWDFVDAQINFGAFNPLSLVYKLVANKAKSTLLKSIKYPYAHRGNKNFLMDNSECIKTYLELTKNYCASILGKDKNPNVVVFGHTHETIYPKEKVAFKKDGNKIWMLNPGAWYGKCKAIGIAISEDMQFRSVNF